MNRIAIRLKDVHEGTLCNPDWHCSQLVKKNERARRKPSIAAQELTEMLSHGMMRVISRASEWSSKVGSGKHAPPSSATQWHHEAAVPRPAAGRRVHSCPKIGKQFLLWERPPRRADILEQPSSFENSATNLAKL